MKYIVDIHIPMERDLSGEFEFDNKQDAINKINDALYLMPEITDLDSPCLHGKYWCGVNDGARAKVSRR